MRTRRGKYTGKKAAKRKAGQAKKLLINKSFI
jgi:hypothetical protein